MNKVKILLSKKLAFLTPQTQDHFITHLKKNLHLYFSVSQNLFYTLLGGLIKQQKLEQFSNHITCISVEISQEAVLANTLQFNSFFNHPPKLKTPLMPLIPAIGGKKNNDIACDKV